MATKVKPAIGGEGDKKTPRGCGTTACIAGWAAFLNHPKDFPNYHLNQIEGIAENALRLNHQQSPKLFYPAALTILLNLESGCNK